MPKIASGSVTAPQKRRPSQSSTLFSKRKLAYFVDNRSYCGQKPFTLPPRFIKHYPRSCSDTEYLTEIEMRFRLALLKRSDHARQLSFVLK